ncbi:single-stranded DNA-binding protein [Hoyosella subflava]|uniref:Single-stranded DNA-binding protein n=1 Tax=Hoyosella subflava (strain DSM 45089 / JCM 17490 / NBRC 109087 / DQS3-9A1) TaxID=443218 RepID=F6EQ88_HOYSD|nr:single-stranded DNA-binding protein [Hoyosella subflava]AEF39511.1 Single-stranded DNA-binding protein [Hoyosella subflava DQS3-9A1]
MYESYTTIVGNVASNMNRRLVGTRGDEVVSFTVASTTRVFDRSNAEWKDGTTLFVRVSCWNRASHRVIASLMKGDPVIVHGDLHTHTYTDNEGQQRMSLEMRARAVGPDVTRCIAQIDRRAPAKTEDKVTPDLTVEQRAEDRAEAEPHEDASEGEGDERALSESGIAVAA